MSLAFTALQPLHARLLAGMHRICFKEPWDEKAMGELLAMPGAAGMLATPGAAGMLATPGAAGMSETLGAGDEGAVPQGFILWRLAGDEAEVLTLLVLPPYRRLGVAGRLLDLAVAHVQGLGGHAFFLEVAADNAAAQQLYSSRGFERVGRRPRYYGGAIDAIVNETASLDASEVGQAFSRCNRWTPSAGSPGSTVRDNMLWPSSRTERGTFRRGSRPFRRTSTCHRIAFFQ